MLTWEWHIRDGEVFINFFDLESEWSGWISLPPDVSRSLGALLIDLADQAQKAIGDNK